MRFLTACALAACWLLFGSALFAQNQPKLKILFVLTSHDQLGNTGEKTGFWIEEFATPYYFFREKGVEITIASPKGGEPPMDPKSNLPDFQTEATKRFFADPEAQKALRNTAKLSTVKHNDFDAVFYPGGHGPLWDLAGDRHSIRLIESFYRNGKPVTFVCHAPAVLKDVKDKDGQPLVKDKRVTGFTNSEEAAVKLTDVVPFLLEDILRERGAIYQKGADWSSFAIEDGLLITGQNPQSSLRAAQLLWGKLQKK